MNIQVCCVCVSERGRERGRESKTRTSVCVWAFVMTYLKTRVRDCNKPPSPESKRWTGKDSPWSTAPQE